MGKKQYISKINNNNPEQNEYYYNISKYYKLSKFLVLFMLIAFLLSMIALFRDDITVENLRYMVKYLDTTSPEYTGNYRTIYYDAVSERRTDIYKGDLVVAKSDSVDLYNMLGNNVLTYSIHYKQPMLLTSKQYMMIYSLGEYSYTINNTFSQLFSETYEYPIYGAALSDSGLYAIISKTLEYRSAVYIYDRNFNKLTQILKDKLVMDVQITPKGDEVLLLSVYNVDGDYCSEILTCNPYSEKENAISILDGDFALKAGYNSTGGYTVICDSKILFYNQDDENIGEYLYNSMTPINYCLSKNYTVMAFNKNIVGNDNHILVFDASGKVVFNKMITGQISSIAQNGDFAYVLLENSIVGINILTGEIMQSAVENNAMNLLIKDDYTLLVCYNQKAIAYSVKDLFYKPDISTEQNLPHKQTDTTNNVGD